ncbi:MAG: HRDC domain-containing protein, partial [Verrucomicrobiota bacterium]|nr:HRDC domain-containing protein [Verrucomicrobiota bacterium]
MAVLKPPPVYRLIDQPAQLAPLLDALDRVAEVALDTEADNLFHYRTRVCLLQFFVAGEIFLVDVLAPLDLAPLWSRLARKHLILHGSDFDLRLLYSLCGFTASSLFDTMLAAQLLGRSRIGLAALLEQHFGIVLAKEGQKANWSRRPLPADLLEYAALDVFYLPALRDILRSELAALGRLEWLEQQCQRQISAGAEGFAPPGENDWRIGRSERLRGPGLSVLHAVWHWRETTARRLDVPPFKVCSNAFLLKIAESAEHGANEAEIMAHVDLGKRHERLVVSLTEAVRAGLALDPQTLPRRRGRGGDFAPLTTEEIARQDALKADRDRVAAQLQFDPTLIANRAQLAQLARTPERLGEILLPWQARLLRQ